MALLGFLKGKWGRDSDEEIVMRRARALITVADRTSEIPSLSDAELEDYGRSVWQNKVKVVELYASLDRRGSKSTDEVMTWHAARKAQNKLEHYWTDAQHQLAKRGKNFYF